MLHIGNDVNFCQEFSDALPGFSGKDFYCNLSSVSNGSLKHSEGICSHQAKKNSKEHSNSRENNNICFSPIYYRRNEYYLIYCSKATSAYFIGAIEVVSGRSQLSIGEEPYVLLCINT
jgi:hypothetical protein